MNRSLLEFRRRYLDSITTMVSAFRRVLLCCTILISCWMGWNTACLAQPGNQSSPNGQREQIERLQRELSQLQSQLRRSPRTDERQENDRVKAIGGQSIRYATPPVVEEVMQIRMYDLSDMFVVSPHYPASLPTGMPILTGSDQPQRFTGRGNVGGGGFGGGGLGGGGLGGGGAGGSFNRPPITPAILPASPPQGSARGSIEVADSQTSINRLVEAIKSTVAPKKWGKDDDDAKIELLGNTLLITASSEMHSQIIHLLDLFREHWGKRRTVTVQTFWIRGTETDAADLLDREKQELIGAGVVEQKAFQAYLAKAKAEKRIVFSATLTGHNNQTLHTFSGRQTTLTTDGEYLATNSVHLDDEGNATAESSKIVGFRPIRKTVFEGPIFQATPLATRGGNFVILDIHAQLNDAPAEKGDTRQVLRVGGDVEVPELVLDSGDQLMAKFSSTLRCPKNEVLLAGAMTADTTQVDAAAPNLLIFVKAVVHTIEEDKSDWNDRTGNPKMDLPAADKPVSPSVESEEPGQ